MADPALQWRVEETCLNAWPALREVLVDGWLVRFGAGLTRRANSANALAPSQGSRCGSYDDLVKECERLYCRHGLPTIFRVLSLSKPGFDRRLEALGYAGEGDSCVLYGMIGDIEAATDPGVRLLPEPTAQWCAAMAALQKHTREQARTYRRIIRQIAIPSAFAALS